jgi:serine/threonine protein kinase
MNQLCLHRLFTNQRLRDIEILTIAFHIAQAIRLLHGRKIIHRDIKMDNIMFIDLGKLGLRFKLGDFGLCIDLNNELVDPIDDYVGFAHWPHMHRLRRGLRQLEDRYYYSEKTDVVGTLLYH